MRKHSQTLQKHHQIHVCPAHTAAHSQNQNQQMMNNNRKYDRLRFGLIQLKCVELFALCSAVSLESPVSPVWHVVVFHDDVTLFQVDLETASLH